MGRLPVTSVQVAVAPVAFVLKKTLPKVLPVMIVSVWPGVPMAMIARGSPFAENVVPVVRSPLIAIQLAEPAGVPPLVVRYTRFVPVSNRAGFVGSMRKGVTKLLGSEHAGSVRAVPQGLAGTNES